MTATLDVLDTVLYDFRIEDGKFLATMGDKTVEVEELHWEGSTGKTYVTYYDDGERVRKLHRDSR